jgi:hypothetical protein
MNTDKIIDWCLIGTYVTIIVLRLFKVINLEWWLIFSPFIIIGTCSISIIVLVTILALCTNLYKKIKNKRGTK